MPKYNCSCMITVSAYCVVEAKNKEEAERLAGDMQPALHFNGSGTYPDQNWLVEEPDGEPFNITVKRATKEDES